MKSQKHNQGELKELTVKIEADVVDCFKDMESKTGIPLDDLVVIALKRYKASHGDYLGKTPNKD